MLMFVLTSVTYLVQLFPSLCIFIPFSVLCFLNVGLITIEVIW